MSGRDGGDRPVTDLTVGELQDLVADAVKAAAGGEPDRELISAATIAERLHVKPDTVRKWHSRCGLPAFRVGKVLRFDLAQVATWIESRMTAPGSWGSLHADRLRLMKEED